jgi:hypothetical protein
MDVLLRPIRDLPCIIGYLRATTLPDPAPHSWQGADYIENWPTMP